jgi:hypothetical protein
LILVDVNVLVYAFRADAPRHAAYRGWLQERATSDQAFGVSYLVLASFLRVVTHPRIFDPPAPLGEATRFVEALRTRPNCVEVRPGPRHWEIFLTLCQQANARGNLVPDCYLAALAIESGSEWITTDRDYARFPGLRWRDPLDR